MINIRQFKEKANKKYIIKKTDVFIYELEDIIDYMMTHYYDDTAIKFRDKLKPKLDILEHNPMVYKEYQENKIYR